MSNFPKMWNGFESKECSVDISKSRKISSCVTWARAGCCVSRSALLSVVLPRPLFKQPWASKGVCGLVSVCCKLPQPGCAHVWLKASLDSFLRSFVIFFNLYFLFLYPFYHELIITWVLRLINCVVTPAYWSLDSREHSGYLFDSGESYQLRWNEDITAAMSCCKTAVCRVCLRSCLSARCRWHHRPCLAFWACSCLTSDSVSSTEVLIIFCLSIDVSKSCPYL